MPQHSASIPALQQYNWCFGGDRGREGGTGQRQTERHRAVPGWKCLYPGGGVLEAVLVIEDQTGHIRTRTGMTKCLTEMN